MRIVPNGNARSSETTTNFSIERPGLLNRQLTASHYLYKKLGFKEVNTATEEESKYAIFMEKTIN